jgi:hypothetical protein
MDVLKSRTDLRQALAAAAAAVGLACGLAAPAAAQQTAPSGRGKFILGLGAGYAATKTDCSNCGSGDEGSTSGDGATYDDVGFVSISTLWRVSAKAVAGVEVQLETARENVRVLYLMGSVRFHPWTAQGFFIRGGFGMVQVKSNVLRPDGSDATGTYRGIGMDYGIGWELFKGSKISFAPFGSHYVSTLASVTLGETESVNVIGNTWVAGIRLFFN